MKKISIIVPTYNNEKYLVRCLDSLFNQDYKDIEVVVVNDGSSDDSLKILNQYNDKYSNMLLINQENSGVSTARNNGIKAATGEYLMFVDGDDWIELDMISSMMKYMENYNADVVKCGYIKDDLVNPKIVKIVNKLEIYESNFKYDLYDNIIKSYNFNSACCQIFKKNLIKNYFNKDIKMGEDLLFNLDIFTNCKMLIALPNCYYHYFDNLNSATTITSLDKVIKRCDDTVYVYNSFHNYKDKWQYLNDKEISYRVIKELNIKLVQLYKIKNLSKKDRIDILKKYFNNETIINNCQNLKILSIFKHMNKNSIFIYLIKRKKYKFYDFILRNLYCKGK